MTTPYSKPQALRIPSDRAAAIAGPADPSLLRAVATLVLAPGEFLFGELTAARLQALADQLEAGDTGVRMTATPAEVNDAIDALNSRVLTARDRGQRLVGLGLDEATTIARALRATETSLQDALDDAEHWKATATATYNVLETERAAAATHREAVAEVVGKLAAEIAHAERLVPTAEHRIALVLTEDNDDPDAIDLEAGAELALQLQREVVA